MSQILGEIETPSNQNEPLLTPESFAQDPSLNELLISSIQYSKGVSEQLRYLVERGVNLNFKFKYPALGNTPLGLACYEDNVEAVKYLLAHGAKPDPQVVFCIKSVEVAELMLAAGADFHARDERGNSALHTVCLINKTPLAEFYLQQGLRLDAKNNCGQTPMHWACSRLISMDPNRPISINHNIFHRSVKENLPTPKNVFFPKISGVERTDRFTTQKTRIETGAPRELNLPLIQLFLDNKGVISEADGFGWTAREYLIGSGWLEKVYDFLDGKKYDERELFITLRDRNSNLMKDYLADGGNPNIMLRSEGLVHIAANNGDCDALDTLLQKGAEVDIRQLDRELEGNWFFGVTPLFSVCTVMNSSDRLQTMKMLVKAGANVNFPCDQYLTPFLILCQDQHYTAIRAMIKIAYAQLLSADILPKHPFKKVQIRHRFDTAPPSRNEVGNMAAKTLIQMYLADENAIDNAQKEFQLKLTQFEQARVERREAMIAFEKTRQEFADNKASVEALDKALNHYLEKSSKAADLSSKMVEANNEASDLVSFHQTADYKTAHQQMGEIIKVMLEQIQCSEEVQKLIDSSTKLPQIIGSSNNQSARL